MGKQAIRWFILIILCLAVCGSGAQAVEAPLKLEIRPIKNIFTAREGLAMEFRFTATERTKLCLSRDFLSQLQLSVYRSGRGKMVLEPLVSRDNQVVFEEKMKVRWLEPGQSVNLRANLKRYRFAKGEQWNGGEYSVKAVFQLCEQTPVEEVRDVGREIPISSQGAAWFMIMN